MLKATRAVAVVAATGALLVVPAPSFAHVRVLPESVVAGSYATLTFKVPTESDTASTTKVEIDLPTDHPFGSVSYQPVPGWTTVVTTAKLKTPINTGHSTITEAPTKIVWTATGDAAIKPGQFQVFPISAGPVPHAASVSFAARQTYSDGSVVKWDQPEVAGKDEPEHPAPTLRITAAGAPTASSSAAAEAPTKTAAKSNDSNSGRWLGVGGIAVGAVALLAAIYAITRRQPSSS